MESGATRVSAVSPSGAGPAAESSSWVVEVLESIACDVVYEPGRSGAPAGAPSEHVASQYPRAVRLEL